MGDIIILSVLVDEATSEAYTLPIRRGEGAIESLISRVSRTLVQMGQRPLSAVEVSVATAAFAERSFCLLRAARWSEEKRRALEIAVFKIVQTDAREGTIDVDVPPDYRRSSP